MSCDFTYEELAGFAAGELEPARADELLKHLGACRACKDRLKAIRAADAALTALAPHPPPAETLLEVRRRLSRVVRGTGAAEIMTLEEVAEFLRVTPEQMGQVMEELPAFELAGQVRVRRQKLLEWLEHREQDYKRQNNESWVARSRSMGLGKGVA